MHAKALLTALASLHLANAAVWNITVAGSNGIVFTPNQVTAAPGDTLHFVFASGGHSVTQGTFESPCTPLSGGFDSNIQSNAGANVDIPVNSTDPIWIHCKQVGHCQAGMLFAANAPSSGQTFDAYQAAATGKSSNTSGSSSSSSVAASAATTTGYTSTGAYGNSASPLKPTVWLAGVVAFAAAAAAV
ncbi:hypothetical protein FRB90_008530 [Tulasnella sp. 427]|nr:hypothetical protein FRB90_008530 [Tulasnella sp. 427]